MRPNEMRNLLNQMLKENTKGIHSDEHWAPISKVWDALRGAEKLFKHLDFTWWIGENYYDNDEKGNLIRKNWKVTVQWTQIESGKRTKEKKCSFLYATISACGCGSVSDPIRKYDVIGYFS